MKYIKICRKYCRSLFSPTYGRSLRLTKSSTFNYQIFIILKHLHHLFLRLKEKGFEATPSTVTVIMFFFFRPNFFFSPNRVISPGPSLPVRVSEILFLLMVITREDGVGLPLV